MKQYSMNKKDEVIKEKMNTVPPQQPNTAAFLWIACILSFKSEIYVFRILLRCCEQN